MARAPIRRARRLKTPTVLQIEAAECGAASLSMIAGRYGASIRVERLRELCGVSRDGAKASGILKAARAIGFEAKGFRVELEAIGEVDLPAIIFTDFNHFMVLEGFNQKRVFLNDPAMGRRSVGWDQFDEMFTGVVLTFAPKADFQRSKERESMFTSLLRRTLGFRIAIALVLVISLGLVLPGVALPVFSRLFVDEVLINANGNWLPALLGGIGLTAVVRFALTEMQRSTLLRVEAQFASRGAQALLEHILKLPLSYFGTRYTGDIANRIELSDGLASLLVGQMAQLALSGITAIFFAFMMVLYSPVVAASVVMLSLLTLILIAVTTRLASELHRKLSIEGAKLDGIALAGLRDIETYKAAGSEQSLFQRWLSGKSQLVSLEQSLGRLMIPAQAAQGLIGAITAAIVLIVGGRGVMAGEFSIGTLVALQTLAASFMSPVIGFAGSIAQFQQAGSFTERIDDVLEHPVDARFITPAGAEHASQNNVAMEPIGTLTFDNVSFGYNPLDPPLIADFDLAVEPSKRIALVGGSGSGKSTLGRLAAGLLHPQSGSVSLSGKSLSEPRSDTGQSIAYVDQETVLFEGTVKDNLTLWDRTIHERQMVQAAKDADIHAVIASRPGHYASLVKENGLNFSGGQRQRLEIARALALNPAILILDEATSALDTVAEARVMDNIIARGCSLVIIAHRLSTIRDCDEIIVIEQGVPVERGTHDQLMANQAHYASLVEA
ncbi:MAG: NHLP family bacteriocin export ABC transporter peptidase/permease/ATPase subunit [Pseudomonadota bacterium]